MVTKEEKKAKKEAKRLEKLRLEEEARKKSKRDELQREMAAQALRRGELDRSWRNLMLQIKEPVFKKDIEIMWRSFERALDKKDHLIQHTIDLINVADNQFQRTFASFCDTLDTMINKFLLDIETMSKENARRTTALLQQDEENTNRVASAHDDAETHLQLMLYQAHSSADALCWSKRGENLVMEDDERDKYMNEREKLRSYLENNYNTIWEEYKIVLKAYVIETSDNQKKVRKLRRKENLMADIIASQSKKIAKSDGMLKRLRSELAAYESGTKQAVFRDRRNRHRCAFFKLKKRLINGCNLDKRQLAQLVKASDDTIEWLEKAHKKGERILKTTALCRRFESQKEKIMPFGSELPQSPNQTMISLRQQQSDESLVANAIKSTSGLTRLWHRISNAELSRRALYREKELLIEENAYITKKIEQFKENKLTADVHKCSCNEKIGQNTMLKKSSISKPNAVEAVLDLKKYSSKLYNTKH